MSDWDETKRDFLVLVAMFAVIYSILMIGVFLENLYFLGIAAIIAVVDLAWVLKKR